MKKWKKSKPESSNITVGSGGHLSSHGRRRLMVVGLVVLLLTAGSVFVFLNKKHNTDTATKVNQEITMVNKSLRENNMSEALIHARQAFAHAPDNFNTILALANLTAKDNPTEAKQLYAHALEVYKKQDDPDANGKNAGTYWAAAGLAEQAGYTDQAKQYYQKVINAARPNNSYDQNLVKQTQAALKRLQ